MRVFKCMRRSVLVVPMMIGLALSPLASLASQALEVPLSGHRSMIRLGAIPNPAAEDARAVAQGLFDALEQKDPARVSKAMGQLQALAKTENVGGGNSAMQWLARAWLESRDAESELARTRPVMEQAYFDYFLADDAKHLKEYLQRKYRAGDFTLKDPETHLVRGTFLEDMLMFNNPMRSDWDATERVLEIVADLKPQVRRVIDLGAGFGYFSQKLAETLGPESIVHAVDTQKDYVEQLRQFVKQYNIEGVRPVVSTPEDINVQEETDLVFIASLYHVLYGWSQPGQRNAFMETLNKTLRPGGYLVVLDNRDNDGVSLHNSFLSKDFAIAQLYFYGFELVRSEDLSPYRYALVLKKAAPEPPKQPVFTQSEQSALIRVDSSDSVVHIGSLDSFDITPSGVAAAKLLMRALNDSDMQSARAAIDLYENLIPSENFGGEYTALQWVAQYLAGSEETRQSMTEDPLSAEFLAYLAEDDYAPLKLYVEKKYKLAAPQVSVEEALDEKTREIGIIRRQALEDFILFNNPRRESWEKSSKILDALPLSSGDTVVDLGSGPGYFSFKFADKVGPEGQVHAFDTKDSHIDYLNSLTKKWEIGNIRASVSSTEGFEIPQPGSADMVFMCSLYHILYAVSSQTERDGMIASTIKALKPGGRFAIVDNGPVDQGKLPYHGPYIRQELIRAQLEAYGFKFESIEQVIPQRYLMVFSHGASAN